MKQVMRDVKPISDGANVPEPLATVNAIAQDQEAQDIAQDMADLRKLMSAALETKDDTKMLQVLGIGNDQMPEAITTLERVIKATSHKTSRTALNRLATIPEKVTALAASAVGASQNNSETVEPSVQEDLDRRFLETGLNALRRLSTDVSHLPSWTITSLEIDKIKKIGLGKWATVYQGKWNGRTVAIKELMDVTPQAKRLFVREVRLLICCIIVRSPTY